MNRARDPDRHAPGRPHEPSCKEPRSPQFREWYGPTVRAFGVMGPAAQARLERDLVELADRFDRLESDDAVAIAATYTEAVAIRR